MPRLAPLASVLAMLLVLLSAAPASPVEEPPGPDRPDLAGHWVLDAKRSDSAPSRLRGAGPPGGGSGRPGGGRPPGGGGRPGEAGGGRGPGGGPEAHRAAAEGMRAAEAALELRPEAAGYLLLDGLGRAWKLPADGREREAEGPEGRTVWLRSEWDLEGRLVVRKVQNGRPTLVETYALDPADGSLVLTRKLSGGRSGEMERRLVYRRAPAPAPAGKSARP